MIAFLDFENDTNLNEISRRLRWRSRASNIFFYLLYWSYILIRYVFWLLILFLSKFFIIITKDEKSIILRINKKLIQV